MKKDYFSPELDYVKLSFEKLLGDVDTSTGEHGKNIDDDSSTGELSNIFLTGTTAPKKAVVPQKGYLQ